MLNHQVRAIVHREYKDALLSVLVESIEWHEKEFKEDPSVVNAVSLDAAYRALGIYKRLFGIG